MCKCKYRSLEFYKMIYILKYGPLRSEKNYPDEFGPWRITDEDKVKTLVGNSRNSLVTRQKTEYLAWKALAEYEPNNGK